MADNVSELFGDRPQRPVHPDFWRISETVLANDAPMEEASTDGQRGVAWRVRTSQVVDVESVTYMALQRALLAGRQLPDLAQLPAQGVIATVWIDAFVAGAGFERAGGHRDKADDATAQLVQVFEGVQGMRQPNMPKLLVVLQARMDVLRAAIDDLPTGTAIDPRSGKLAGIKAAYEEAVEALAAVTGVQP